MAIRKGNEIVKTTTGTDIPPKLAKRKSEQVNEEKKLNGEETKLKKSTSSLAAEKFIFLLLFIYLSGKRNVVNQWIRQTS